MLNTFLKVLYICGQILKLLTMTEKNRGDNVSAVLPQNLWCNFDNLLLYWNCLLMNFSYIEK